MAAFLLLVLNLLFAGAHTGLDPDGDPADSPAIVETDEPSGDARLGWDPNG